MAKYIFRVDYYETILRTQEITIEAESLAEAEDLAFETDELNYQIGKNIVNVETGIDEVFCVDCPKEENDENEV